MTVGCRLNSAIHRALRSLPARIGLRIRSRFDEARRIIDAEISHAHRFTTHRRLAVDVGANNGVSSEILSRHFAVVESFEPNPVLAASAAKALAPNVHVHQLALSSTDGEAKLRIPVSSGFELDGWASLDRPLTGDETTWKEVAVRTRTLDSFSFAAVDLIKIDVEGHELAVLEGARHTISHHRPPVIVEVWDGARQAIEAFFSSHDYRCSTLEQLCGIPGSPQNLIFIPK